MGCSVAGETIDELDSMAKLDVPTAWTPYRQDWEDTAVWSMWRRDTVNKLSHLPQVESVMALGSVLAIELRDDQSKGKYTSVSIPYAICSRYCQATVPLFPSRSSKRCVTAILMQASICLLGHSATLFTSWLPKSRPLIASENARRFCLNVSSNDPDLAIVFFSFRCFFCSYIYFNSIVWNPSSSRCAPFRVLYDADGYGGCNVVVVVVVVAGLWSPAGATSWCLVLTRYNT